MRLSFAVRPPEHVTAALAAVPRPETARVGWSVPELWIVKLRPLGHVPESVVPDLVEVVEAALDGAPTVEATAGPMAQRIGGDWLALPVYGLAELGAEIFAASEPLVPVTHPQPFRADLVLARGHVPKDLRVELTVSWTVREVLLVADRSAPGRPRLEDLARIPFGDEAPVRAG